MEPERRAQVPLGGGASAKRRSPHGSKAAHPCKCRKPIRVLGRRHRASPRALAVPAGRGVGLGTEQRALPRVAGEPRVATVLFQQRRPQRGVVRGHRVAVLAEPRGRGKAPTRQPLTRACNLDRGCSSGAFTGAARSRGRFARVTGRSGLQRHRVPGETAAVRLRTGGRVLRVTRGLKAPIPDTTAIRSLAALAFRTSRVRRRTRGKGLAATHQPCVAGRANTIKPPTTFLEHTARVATGIHRHHGLGFPTRRRARAPSGDDHCQTQAAEANELGHDAPHGVSRRDARVEHAAMERPGIASVNAQHAGWPFSRVTGADGGCG